MRRRSGVIELKGQAIPRAGVNATFLAASDARMARSAVDTAHRAEHQRPDKLELHVEICRDFPGSHSQKNRSKSVQCRFTYER